MKLGAQLYSVRNIMQTPEDAKTTFQALKKMGYENVQLSGCGPIDPAVMHDISCETGLPIICTHVAIERLINDTEALIKEHHILDCSVIGLGSMPKEYRDTMEGVNTFFSILEEPVKKLMNAGFSFSYHNHFFEFEKPEGSDQLLFDIMLERCPHWLFLLDTAWVEFAGYSAVEYIEKIGGKRLPNIHFKDITSKVDHHDICSCGKGLMDFAPIYEACKKVGVQNILVEQDNAAKMPDPLGEMEASLHYLRPLIQ